MLILITNYYYFKNFENWTRSYLMYWGRNACGILSLWVIFEVHIVVSVNRAVFLILTKYRLIEIYHSLFFYQEFRGGMFLNRYGEKRASSFLQNICKFLPHFISWEVSLMKHRWTATDIQRHVPCLNVVDEWDGFVPLNVHTFHSNGKSSAVGI